MKIAVLGCGVMGSAFARHFAKQCSVLLCGHDKIKTQALAKEIGAVFEEDLSVAVQEAHIILLAIKPKDLRTVAKACADAFTEGKILLSILAGTSISLLQRNFPKATVVRSMPNLAFISGQGVMGLAENGHYSPQLKQQIDALLDGIGLIAWMTEDKIDALTALSGSGIGFVLVMIEAMIDGGVYLGFSANESREIVLKTIEGAIALMRESGKHPAELKLQISSPGGTTIAGLKVMEEEGVRPGIVRALVACYEKSQSMMKNQEK